MALLAGLRHQPGELDRRIPPKWVFGQPAWPSCSSLVASLLSQISLQLSVRLFTYLLLLLITQTINYLISCLKF